MRPKQVLSATLRLIFEIKFWILPEQKLFIVAKTSLDHITFRYAKISHDYELYDPVWGFDPQVRSCDL